MDLLYVWTIRGGGGGIDCQTTETGLYPSILKLLDDPLPFKTVVIQIF